MDSRPIDRFARRLAAAGSRRRLLAALAGGALGAHPLARLGETGAAAAKQPKPRKRCRQPQQRCSKAAQCCRRKLHTCGYSHGGGSAVRTCCGQAGTKCNGSALGCCIPLVCGPDNTCAEPTM